MFNSLFNKQRASQKSRVASKDRSVSKPIVQEPSKTFQEIAIVKQLNKAKFPVYLVRSKVNNKTYAMKTFPYQNDKLHPYYQNEIRFSDLQHNNVIQNFYFENERRTKTDKGAISNISLKIMEFAPYGDFFDLVMNYGKIMDEKLVRSYFKQLIEGLEYLHCNGVSHLDLKLENILIGDEFTLKIADFDLSHFAGDAKIISRGTKFYRAPELIQSKVKDPKLADIYAAGIVLFTFKTQGILPHAENSSVHGVDFSLLLHSNDPRFWTEHCKIQGRQESFFDEDFKELFLAMTQPNPENRATIETIKKSKWYNGPCYTPEEIKNRMKKISWK